MMMTTIMMPLLSLQSSAGDSNDTVTAMCACCACRACGYQPVPHEAYWFAQHEASVTAMQHAANSCYSGIYHLFLCALHSISNSAHTRPENIYMIRLAYPSQTCPYAHLMLYLTWLPSANAQCSLS